MAIRTFVCSVYGVVGYSSYRQADDAGVADRRNCSFAFRKNVSWSLNHERELELTAESRRPIGRRRAAKKEK
jgi:hypothetical protein